MDSYRDWEKAVNSGALSHDNLSLNAFQTNVEVGVQKAQEYCSRSPTLFYGASDLEYLHSLIFQNVLTSAGRYKEVETEPWYDRVRDIFDPDEPAEDSPQRQEHYTKIDKLRLEAQQMYHAGLDTKEKCSVLAFYHAALVSLDPFTVGTRVAAKTITQAQVEKVFGKEIGLSFDPDTYNGAIKDAQLGKGLESLSSLIRDGIGPKQKLATSLEKQIERIERTIDF